jgi:uncharacterized membrane protein
MSRAVVTTAVIAALYTVFTLALAPISYGPVQFRAAELLKPLALYNPIFALGFGLGNFFANLGSPFGAWDFIIMPLVDIGAALLCWQLRRWPVPAVTTQAIVISAGVAVFPLGLGGRFPVLPSFLAVLLSELIILVLGYLVIWRKYGSDLLRRWQ